MYENTFTAGTRPANLPTGRKVNNLVKRLDPPKEIIPEFVKSREFPPDLVKSQIRNFCNEAARKITEECEVKAIINRRGAKVIVTAKNYSFSFIYREGGKS